MRWLSYRTGRRTADVVCSYSVACALHCGPRSGCRTVERTVHLLEGATLGFRAEYPKADHAKDEPRCEIDESRAEHVEVGRRRLDDVAGPHDQRQARRSQDFAA